MTQQEFREKLNKEFNKQDILNISPAVYLHPDHLDYYENFHLEEYEWCYNYLIKNRSLFEGKDYETLVYEMGAAQQKS